jgi:hypothetical protein
MPAAAAHQLPRPTPPTVQKLGPNRDGEPLPPRRGAGWYQPKIASDDRPGFARVPGIGGVGELHQIIAVAGLLPSAPAGILPALLLRPVDLDKSDCARDAGPCGTLQAAVPVLCAGRIRGIVNAPQGGAGSLRLRPLAGGPDFGCRGGSVSAGANGHHGKSLDGGGTLGLG